MRISSVLLALLLFGCATSGDKWTTLHTGPFTMRLPADLKQTPRTSTDSYVEEFRNSRLDVSFDYGFSANNFEDWPTQTEYEEVAAGDVPGRIGTIHRGFKSGYAYSTQIAFRETGEKYLTITAACKTKADVATARKIFMSVKFKPKEPQE
jgi:hypothetical protein